MSTYANREYTAIPALAPGIGTRINALHADVQRMECESRQKLNHAATAAWHAGKLLLEAKASIVRHCGHGAWMPWLAAIFKGSARTARRYMKLARELPDALAPDGLSLRQLYFRLGISTEPKAPKSTAYRPIAIPRHIVLANKLVRVLRQSQLRRQRTDCFLCAHEAVEPPLVFDFIKDVFCIRPLSIQSHHLLIVRGRLASCFARHYHAPGPAPSFKFDFSLGYLPCSAVQWPFPLAFPPSNGSPCARFWFV